MDVRLSLAIELLNSHVGGKILTYDAGRARDLAGEAYAMSMCGFSCPASRVKVKSSSRAARSPPGAIESSYNILHSKAARRF